MSDIAVRAEGLGKRYRIGAPRHHDTLRDAIGAAAGRFLRGRRASLDLDAGEDAVPVSRAPATPSNCAQKSTTKSSSAQETS